MYFRLAVFAATAAAAKVQDADLTKLIKSINTDSQEASFARDATDSVRQNLIAGQRAFSAATDALTYSPEQAEISAALQSAALGGSAAATAGSSTGAASFLQTPSKISMDQLSSIAANVEAAASRRVASGRASSTCGTCTPNFSVCPSGFISNGGSCSPSASYAGFCNKDFSLADYSPVELEEFEVFCDSCFPCSHSSFLNNPAAAKDNLVKDGLFLTQPLRGDEQVRVNIIEREPAFANSARNVAAASSNAYLRAKFDADLAKLRSSFLRFVDISSRNAAAPVEVINFAIESGIPDALQARRAADMKDAEAAAAANLSRRRIAAQNALASLESTERHHAQQIKDLLG